jgi:hypothetical protein
MQTRTLFPTDRPAYQIVAKVNWICTPDLLEAAAEVMVFYLRPAPRELLMPELYKLRSNTRGREVREETAAEANFMVWAEQLQAYPADIAIAGLRAWPRTPGGQWWPTWHEMAAELDQAAQRRRMLAGAIVALATATAAIEDKGPTQEERDRAVAYWAEERKTRGVAEARERAPAAFTGEAMGAAMRKSLEDMKIGRGKDGVIRPQDAIRPSKEADDDEATT